MIYSARGIPPKFGTIKLVRVPDDQYESSQSAVFSRYKNWRVPGFVTAIVSQPYTTDSDGRSEQYDWHQTVSPFLVLKSRNPWREIHGNYLGPFAPVGSEDDIAEVARIFLHELGHNMGLGHSDINNPSLPILTNGLVKQFTDPKDFNTDNYYRVDPDFLVLYAEKLRQAR